MRHDSALVAARYARSTVTDLDVTDLDVTDLDVTDLDVTDLERIDMSIGVELEDLREAIDATGRAPYLLTVGDDGRPHSVAADSTWHGDELVLSVGNQTLANARARTIVSVLWAPSDADGYSLIVDGDVTHAEGTGAGDNVVHVRPTRAVLHRSASGTSESSCESDCVPLLPEA